MKAIGKGARTARVIMIAILCFMAIFEIFPLIWMFDFSLGSATDVFAGKLLMIPDPVQWDNYAAAWTQGRVPQYFLNSVICVGCAIVLTVFIALTTGYACSRMDWKLSKFVYFLSIIGMMIPMHATLLPNYIIANQLGILNTYLVLILNYTSRQIPFAIMVT